LPHLDDGDLGIDKILPRGAGYRDAMVTIAHVVDPIDKDQFDRAALSKQPEIQQRSTSVSR
jgi:hypothetical protein